MASPSSSSQDLFDTLPDPILLLIFSKLSHAKSLSQCLIICKRFTSLIYQTDTVFLPTIPQKTTPNNKTPKSLFKFLLRKLMISKSNTKTSNNNISYHSPVHLLKNFNFIKSLHIQVPCLDPKMKSIRNRKNKPDSLLKWKADFGSEFKSCVVLVANEFVNNNNNNNNQISHGEEIINFGGNQNRNQNLSDEELRVRIIQTISCLISVSARHCLLKQILEEHESIENVSVSDVEKQGVLSLGKDEIAEMRDSMMKKSAIEEVVRSRVPDLRMKLWYVPVLKLPESGFFMRGATLVVIGPVSGDGDGVAGKGDDGDGEGDCGGVGGELLGFDGEEDEKKGLDEAVKEIVKMERNYYVMTVNSF